MKFTNLIIGIAFVSVFSFVLFNGISSCRKLDEKFKVSIAHQSSEEFIAESFRNTCVGEGFEDLNQWQIKCRDMFGLDYIAWSNANEFMDVSMKNTCTELFYGVWIKNGQQKEVYCRKRL